MVCAALLELAERELALVVSGAYEDLDAVHAERLRLLELLPAPGTLHEAGKTVLRAAAHMQLTAREAMRQRRDRLAAELGRTDHARRAAAGYARSAAI